MIRFAHVSDLHLSTTNDAATARAQAVLNYLDDLCGELSCVLVTGDITADAETEQWALAQQVLASRHPVITVRGNHDVPEERRRRYPEDHDLGGLRLLTIDSNLPGQVEGSVRDQMLWLDDHLSRGQASVIAMHHPPTPLHHPLDDQGLIDAHELEEVVSRHPRCLAILHGHCHSPSFTRLGNLPVIGAGGVVSTFGLAFEPKQFAGPATVMFHSFDGHRFATHVRVVPGT